MAVVHDVSRAELTEYANVVRSMISSENELINARMGWLLTVQGFLFAALSFVWSERAGLIFVLAALGVVVAASLGFSMRCAVRALERLAQHWADLAEEWAYAGPPVIGLGPDDLPFWAHLLLPWRVIPVALIVAWIVVLLIRLTMSPVGPPAGAV